MLKEKMPKIEKAAKTGFCFGVRRAIDLLEKIARERGGVETLGAVVHNQQVLQKLADIGVKVVNNIDDITGDTVLPAHTASVPTWRKVSGPATSMSSAPSAALSAGRRSPPSDWPIRASSSSSTVTATTPR